MLRGWMDLRYPCEPTSQYSIPVTSLQISSRRLQSRPISGAGRDDPGAGDCEAAGAEIDRSGRLSVRFSEVPDRWYRPGTAQPSFSPCRMNPPGFFTSRSCAYAAIARHFDAGKDRARSRAVGASTPTPVRTRVTACSGLVSGAGPEPDPDAC